MLQMLLRRFIFVCTASIQFIIVSINCYGQSTSNIRPAIKEIVEKIASYNILENYIVAGAKAGQSTQWKRFLAIKDQATEQELIVLTKYNNPIVRCYAFLALTNRKSKEIFPVLIDHLTDTQFVVTLQFDNEDEIRVGDFFYFITADKISIKEKNKVDSMLLYNDNIILQAKNNLIKKLNNDSSKYKRIRAIAIKQKDPDVIVSLAKFHNKQDIPIIKILLTSKDDSLVYYGLWAVRNFPDSAFFPNIVDIHSNYLRETPTIDHVLLRMLYQAIVQYKNEASRQLLQKSLSSTIHYNLTHRQLIWLAIEKYPDQIYNGLQDKAFLTEEDRNAMRYEMDAANDK